MKAMILAAGRGERMGDLTQTIPKPLLKCRGKYLIEHMILNLQRAGICEIIINVSYLAEQIILALGDGSKYGISLSYSHEKNRLETGGGILKALPFFANQPFLVVSGDILTDFPLQTLIGKLQGLAHLVMVDNPGYHRQGDFAFCDQYLSLSGQPKFTFANMGVYHPDLFAHCSADHFPLSLLLRPAIVSRQVTGEYYQGAWYNVGTPSELDYAQGSF